MENVASQLEKLESANETVFSSPVDLQFRAIAVTEAQRFVIRHRAADVFLEIINSALDPADGN
jgi:hypothetical protein